MLYVAPDGNYGEAEDIVIVDNESFDEHFYGYLDDCSDWLRPSYAQWFSENDHDFVSNDNIQFECDTCQDWIEDFKAKQI